MLNSENINEVVEALSKAQEDIKAPVKDKKGQYNEYATLGSILTAIKSPLAKHGLVVTQQLGRDGEHTVLLTTLWHKSGQWIRSSIPVTPSKNTNALQGVGMSLTYLKRYSLSALLCIDADEDDDGKHFYDNKNLSMASEKPFKQEQKPQQPQKEMLKQELIDELTSKLHPDDKASLAAYCKKNYGSEDLRHLPRKVYDQALEKAISKLNEEMGDED